HIAFCPEETRASMPRSLTTASSDCQGGFCHQVIRLDGDPWFDDPANGGDGRWWLAYSWYTNTPPAVAWEQDHYGEHLSIVQLDANDPFTVPCTTDVPQIFAVDAHDANLEAQLAASCDRCGEQLSFVNARDDQPFFREGFVFGIAEAASL